MPPVLENRNEDAMKTDIQNPVIIRVGSHRARETMHRVLGEKLKGHYRMSPNPAKITDGHDYYVLTHEQWEKVCSIKGITRAPRAITVDELGARWMDDGK
jgi:hypothetical protein